MKISLEFHLKNPELPKDYRRCFLSIIKSALSLYNDGILIDKYYEGTNQKDFTWGLILSHPLFQKDKIVLDNLKIRMIISTDDTKKTGYHLFLSFLKLKNVQLPLPNGNEMILKTITQLNQKVLDKNCYVFKVVAGSPIVVRNHEKESNTDTYYSIADENFEVKLIESLKRQASMVGFSEEYTNSISVKVISCKKVVVYNYGIYIDATAGVLEISGSPILLQHFYQAGISSKRSSGFGMIDVV